MTRLLSIDPGVHGIGLAVWDDAALAHVAYVPVLDLHALREELRTWDADKIVCEIPQVYRTGLLKGDPNDLIEIALVAGVCLSVALFAEAVRPHAWKGQTPKEIHNRRVMAKLSEAWTTELNRIVKTKRHNVIDAVGLGQWHIERRGG